MVAVSGGVVAMDRDAAGRRSASHWASLWTFVGQERNRAVLGWVGSGLVVLATGLWAVITFAFPDKPSAPALPTTACAQQGIAAGRDAAHNSITINGTGGAAGSLACADAARK